MKLHILGCYSATPKTNTHPTAQVLEMRNHHFLIDCGEGTQVQLRKAKVKFSRIQHIFISHLHGDHYFGLVGLISTFQLLGRKTPLHIFGPKGIKEIVCLQLRLGHSWTQFDLHFIELEANTQECILETNTFTVHTIPLKHRIYTNGFLFKEKPAPRKLDAQAAVNAGIDKAYFLKLKQGVDVPNKEGQMVDHLMVTSAPETPKSYAFCSDTAYFPEIIPFIKDATVLYHEATFLNEHEHLCKPTGHSSAQQAAAIAKQAGVGELILGHYSTRYDNLNLFLEEASSVFKPVSLAQDLKMYTW